MFWLINKNLVKLEMIIYIRKYKNLIEFEMIIYIREYL